MTNFVFFTLIYTWMTNKISTFTTTLMGSVMLWVSGLALVLVTIWILITGYRVITGQLREPLIAVVTQMARVVIILSAATTMSVFGANLSTFLTTDLSNEINQVVTGSTDSVYADIDKNLALTEVAMSAIDAVQMATGAAADQNTTNKQSQASFLAGIGTAGPPMTAAVMLLMYQFAMALFVGFGPLFIMCLMFEQTKPLFQRWLLYGIGTMFSLAILNVVTSMVLELTSLVAGGLWAISAIQAFTPGSTEGLSHEAMEQGGVGMILTLLIVTVPPMTANFFQGTLGNFMFQSAFGYGGGAAHMGPSGQLMQGGNAAAPQSSTSQVNSAQTSASVGAYSGSYNASGANQASSDSVKPRSSLS